MYRRVHAKSRPNGRKTLTISALAVLHRTRPFDVAPGTAWNGNGTPAQAGLPAAARAAR
jgi:hypothetical protein